MGIVVIGAVFVDIKGFPDDYYIPQGRNVGHIETVHGGVSRNVAEDIANVELRPTYVSLVDDSGTGEEVIQKLKSHKVNTSYIRKVHSGMGTWLAVFDHTGDVVGSISQRPNILPILDILEEQGDEIFSQADSIVIEIDMDKEIVKKCFKLAKKHNKPIFTVVANMSIAVQRRDFLLETDCFICNRQEAGVLFGLDMEHMEPGEVLEALEPNMARLGIRTMVITMDKDGAAYAELRTKEPEMGICPAEPVTLVDSTGAGDAFFAGVSAGLIEGDSLEQACRKGTKMAAQVITSTENTIPSHAVMFPG